MMTDPTLVQPMNRVVIVGLGLIGGSFALGLKAHGLCHEVIGCSRSQATLDKGLALGIIDRAEIDIQKAVAGADLVLLAAPIGSTETLLRAMAPGLDGATVVTDAGSVKGNVIKAAEVVFGKVPPWFVPGHPIAGSEQSGVTAAKVDLYQNKFEVKTKKPSGEADGFGRSYVETQLVPVEPVEPVAFLELPPESSAEAPNPTAIAATVASVAPMPPWASPSREEAVPSSGPPDSSPSSA